MSVEQAAAAEQQLRQLIAETNAGGRSLSHPPLAAFLAHLPTMRMSDLVCYLIDPIALSKAIELQQAKEDGGDDGYLIAFAAVFAIKDEIDRRFPLQARPL